MRALALHSWTAALLIPLAAAASDGVLEINHVCATTGGCFPGDAAGYPVTLDNIGRSFRLTSDLLVPNANTSGIFINGGTASWTSIDLNGFSILRQTCTGLQQGCSVIAGTGSGISGGGAEAVSVHGGSVVGMGSHGVHLLHHARVADLRVVASGGDGILTGNGAVISGSSVEFGDGSGIVTGVYSTVAGNSVGFTGGDGFRVSDYSNVSANTAWNNDGWGISAGVGSTVSGNSAANNDDGGITASNGSTVSANTTSVNLGDGIFALAGSTVAGNTALDNSEDGIEANAGSTVHNNTARLNGMFGLRLAPGVSYRENTLTSNVTGPVTGGVNRGDNYCSGTATVADTCP